MQMHRIKTGTRIRTKENHETKIRLGKKKCLITTSNNIITNNIINVPFFQICVLFHIHLKPIILLIAELISYFYVIKMY
jgi:hypothetical protein